MTRCSGFRKADGKGCAVSAGDCRCRFSQRPIWSGMSGGDVFESVRPSSMQNNRSIARRVVRAVTLLCAAIVVCARASAAEPTPRPDAGRAFGYLKQICNLGSRTSGTDGMLRQQELLEKHFTELKADVKYQSFDTTHPVSGAPVRLANMIVSWQPDATERVLICCHYDTRPHPDRDQLAANRSKPFIGANDGASGAALLMEMGHHMPNIKPTYGVDFVFFDAEELVYQVDGGKYFIGSEYFATDYRDNPPGYQYKAGVLVDMIGDRYLELYYEKNSMSYAPEITKSIWGVAARLRVGEFRPQRRHEVRDDHLALNQIAGIPTCDLIDFDYPHWHTLRDAPAACSGESIATVGRVLLTWLTEVPQ